MRKVSSARSTTASDVQEGTPTPTNVEDDETKSSNKTPKRTTKSKSKAIAASEASESEDEPLGVKMKKLSKEKVTTKNASKPENGSSGEAEASESEAESYEVQLILDSRVRHGKQQFKIRWKGYGPADDSWEDEENVDSPDLIAAFLRGPDEKSAKSPPKKNKTAKGKKRKNSALQKDKPTPKKPKPSDAADSDSEYEVSKIMDYVELKDGTRQFLVRWKGFSAKQNTWEPEANLNCPELIKKFLELEQEKEDSARETRTIRKQVYKYNPELTKRSSHRFSTKKRVSYHDLE